MVMIDSLLLRCVHLYSEASHRQVQSALHDEALHVQANLASLWSCPLLCGTRQVGHPKIIRQVTIQSCPVSLLHICNSTSQHRGPIMLSARKIFANAAVR